PFGGGQVRRGGVQGGGRETALRIGGATALADTVTAVFLVNHGSRSEEGGGRHVSQGRGPPRVGAARPTTPGCRWRGGAVSAVSRMGAAMGCRAGGTGGRVGSRHGGRTRRTHGTRRRS